MADVFRPTLDDQVSSNPDVSANTTARHDQNTDIALDQGQPNEVTAAELRGHVDDATIHRAINDAGAGTTDLWSADKIQAQIDAATIASALKWKGAWDASTNTPSLASGVGTEGDYYRVSVAGTTNLDGITDWQVGDHLIFGSGAWFKIDNSDQVVSVNGEQGAVVLDSGDITEGTNLYYTEGRVSANSDVAANTAARHDAVTLAGVPGDTTNDTLSLFQQQVTVNLATTTTDGAMSAADKLKLDGIDNGATDDQNAPEVPYTPTTGADWSPAPTEVGGSLDQLADRVKTLEADTHADPGIFAGAGTTGIVPDPVTTTGKVLTDNGTWQATGNGDMLASTYDPTAVGGDAFDADNHAYTATVGTDWTDPDPANTQAALDQVASRLTSLEGDSHADHANRAALDLVSGTNTGDEVQATEILKGIAEIATQAEVDAGTDDLRFVTPAKLAAYSGLGDGHTHANLAALDLVSGTNTGDEAAASTTVAGVAEIATQAEVDAGTDNTRFVTPQTLANYVNTGDGHTHANLAALDLVAGTNTGDEVAATELVQGIAEIATQAETDTGTDDTRFITPAKLANYSGLGDGHTHPNLAALNNVSGTNTGDEVAASETIAGIAELATQAEVDAGIDALRIVTPATLANYVNTGDGHTHANLAALDLVSGTNTGDEAPANTETAGIAEIATQAEVDAGTDTTRYVTPATLANAPVQAHTHAASDITSGTFADALISSSSVTQHINDAGTTAGDIWSADKIQTQIDTAVTGALVWKGTWDASTNTPTLTSGVGTNGDYYRVSVAGTTNLDGVTEWQAGDHVTFDGTAWQKIDNTDLVASVAGKTGAVVLDAADIASGTFADARISSSSVTQHLPAASETVSGIAEIATQAETDAGADDLRFVTPAKLANYPFPDEKVKVSANDTTSGDLEAKIVGGTGVTVTTLNEGADEDLEISATFLRMKAGKVLAASFTGNPHEAAVVFSTPFADTNYAVQIVIEATNGQHGWAPVIHSTATTGFTISLDSGSKAGLVAVHWVAMATGEA